MVSILEVKIFCWTLIFIFMKSPKEINNQIIIEENPMVNDEVIQDNYNSEDDYTWDDNKQHTEQCFF